MSLPSPTCWQGYFAFVVVRKVQMREARLVKRRGAGEGPPYVRVSGSRRRLWHIGTRLAVTDSLASYIKSTW